jgi:glyoxylase-like metal-dependent hydrolase (beta-lactamase superfamily II)
VVVGDVEEGSLVDAVGELADLASAFPAVAAESWDPYRGLYPTTFAGPRWRLQVAVLVVRSGGKTVLVDTGVGPAGLWRFWATECEGLLPSALQASGVARESVDVVFLTHLHIDHLHWNTDEAGETFFPWARYVVHPDALASALADPERADSETYVVCGHYPGSGIGRIVSRAGRVVWQECA